MRRISRTLWCARMLSAILIAAVPLGAQSVGGFVRDSAGGPIANALVSIEALSRSTTTDSVGRYSLTAPQGLRLIQVRRVGFSGASRMVMVKEGTTADFVLARVVVTLDTVRRIEQYKPTDILMMEYLDNRKIGLGHFITRPQMDSLRGRHLSEALNQIPGTMIIYSNASGTAWLASSRIRSLTGECVHLEDGKRPYSPVQDAPCALCFPAVFMDFTRLSTGGEVPNLNRFTPETLEAAEVFADAAQLPPRYGGIVSNCGVIVLHVRRSWP